MDDSQSNTPSSPASQRFLREHSLSRLILFGVLVFFFWLGSLVFICHRLNVTHLEQHRLQTLASVGEAMTITGVLFSGLGFVVLIATVWLQRTQVEAAIQSMEESTKTQQENLDTLRAQSDATLAVAQITALSILIPLKQNELDIGRGNLNMGLSDRLTARLPALEQEQIDRMAELESLLKQVKYKREA